MSKYSKIVYLKLLGKVEPLRQLLEVEAKDKMEAEELLNEMAEIYAKKLDGELPSSIATKLKSIKKEESTVDLKTIKMLKNMFGRK